MATIRRLLCLAGCTLVVSLFSPASAQDQSNLELSNPRFKQQQSVRFNPRFTAALSGRDADDYVAGNTKPPRGLQEQTIYSWWTSRAEAFTHNTSPKTIRAVVWEYIFFADAGMNRVLGRYSIYTKNRLRAGETRILKGEVGAPALSPYQKVLPLRVEYTDGTVWQSP